MPKLDDVKKVKAGAVALLEAVDKAKDKRVLIATIESPNGLRWDGLCRIFSQDGENNQLLTPERINDFRKGLELRLGHHSRPIYMTDYFRRGLDLCIRVCKMEDIYYV